jgi:hypothetical protein
MIDLRRAYFIAGVLWALILGPAVALGAFAFGAGVSWLYLFGDNPWPSAVEWLMPSISLVAGSITAVLAVWFGYSHGQKLATSEARDSERRKAILLVVAPIVIFAAVALSIWARTRAFQEAMTVAAARETSFAEFTASNQRVISLRVEYDNDEDLRAFVELNGARVGIYHLGWWVSPSTFDRAVISGSFELELHGEASQETIRFSLSELRSGYQAEILKGGTGVFVDEPFEFDVSLEPVIAAEELVQLPPGELRRLGTEDSPLVSFASTPFPVTFLIP